MGIRDLDLTLTFEPLYESQSYFFIYTQMTDTMMHLAHQRQYVIWVFNSISSFNTVHHFPSSFLALS